MVRARMNARFAGVLTTIHTKNKLNQGKHEKERRAGVHTHIHI